MTDLRQAAQAVLDAWDSPLWKTGTTAAKIADLRTALEQQADPVAWDKPSASFNAWWDSDYHDPANPFAEGSAAYWAWAGWKSAQRPWVGLTDDEVMSVLDHCEDSRIAVARAIEAKLKEKNT